MFERFTVGARRAVVLAQDEARMLSHSYIGTEQLLLGMLSEGEGAGAKALEFSGVSLEAVRRQIREIIGLGTKPSAEHLPFTPRAKKVLELSLREALQLGQSHIGTEHILLGLIREGSGVGATILVHLGVDLNALRQQVLRSFLADAGGRSMARGAFGGADAPSLVSVESGMHPVPDAVGSAFVRNLTERAQWVLFLAQEEARLLDHSDLGRVHILLALLRDGEGVAAQALESLGVSFEAVHRQVEEIVGRGQQAPSGRIYLTAHAQKALELALREAGQLGHSHIAPEHLLLGLIRGEPGVVVAKALDRLGTDPDRIRQQVLHLLVSRGSSETATAAAPADAPFARASLLGRFGRDLTPAARASWLGPVIGREKEVERVVQILTRQLRNVPLLIGEPGVGREAVAAGLAEAIDAGAVPPVLRGRTVCSLDLGALLADPQHRGRAAALIAELVDEVRRHPGLVLFLKAALNPLYLPDGATNAFALFQSLLGAPGVFVLGAGDQGAFERRDLHPSLDRLLQPVPVDEPPASEVLDILRTVRGRLEQHHRVSFTDEALKAAASLARDHVPDQLLPGAAIDLLDEAAAQARVRVSRSVQAPEAAGAAGAAVPAGTEAARGRLTKDKEIAGVRQAKEAALFQLDFERAAKLRYQEAQLVRDKEEQLLRDQEAQLVRDQEEPVAGPLQILVPEGGPQEPEETAQWLRITDADVVTALAVYSGTQSPAPSRTGTGTSTSRRIPPAEHDPYVWAMS